ncbi:MAG: DUF4974 domain-containing protein [Pedobacter sp.]|nr:MAG: DUF4974 domain-containing protein [Pedobacter sp.]
MKVTKELINKYLAGECTEEEAALVESWYLKTSDVAEPELNRVDLDKLQQETWEAIKPLTGKRRFPLSKSLAVAASLLIISVSTFFYLRDKNQILNADEITSLKQKINVGSEKAILTLADGRKINLDSLILQKPESRKDLNTFIASEFSLANAEQNVQAHQIDIPKGGEFHFFLADGTEVWLNSESSFSFPSQFVGTERKVTLTGEGYFEVAKDKKRPFKVLANETEIEVLGTHFNVKSYKDEQKTIVTLAEGSVKVSKASEQVILKPNQEAEVDRAHSSIKVSPAYVAESLAWKDGFFIFDNANIKDIMKTLSRWYDFEIVYANVPSQKKFGGTFSRYKDIKDLLASLESLGAGHFSVEGRKITVTP